MFPTDFIHLFVMRNQKCDFYDSKTTHKYVRKFNLRIFKLENKFAYIFPTVARIMLLNFMGMHINVS